MAQTCTIKQVFRMIQAYQFFNTYPNQRTRQQLLVKLDRPHVTLLAESGWTRWASHLKRLKEKQGIHHAAQACGGNKNLFAKGMQLKMTSFFAYSVLQ